jgi:hypothetical protein
MFTVPKARAEEHLYIWFKLPISSDLQQNVPAIKLCSF